MLQHVALETRPDDAERCAAFWALLGFHRVEPPDPLVGSTTWVQHGSRSWPPRHRDDRFRSEPKAPMRRKRTLFRELTSLIRMRTPLLILILVGAISLGLLAGCGSSGGNGGGGSGGSGGGGSAAAGSSPSSSFINNEKLERSIEASVRQQRRRRVVASCPPLVKIKKGGTFLCTVATGRGDTRFRVTMKDDKGNVHYEAVPR